MPQHRFNSSVLADVAVSTPTRPLWELMMPGAIKTAPGYTNKTKHYKFGCFSNLPNCGAGHNDATFQRWARWFYTDAEVDGFQSAIMPTVGRLRSLSGAVIAGTQRCWRIEDVHLLVYQKSSSRVSGAGATPPARPSLCSHSSATFMLSLFPQFVSPFIMK